jgi:hypothetical protein
MIKGITQSGRYTMVSGGQSSGPYFNQSYSAGQNLMVGQVRYNPSSQSMEAYDGSTWLQLGGSYASVGLTGEAESLLDWARDKRNEEFQWKALAEQHPAVADALESLRLAEERVKIVATLTKETPKVQPV